MSFSSLPSSHCPEHVTVGPDELNVLLSAPSSWPSSSQQKWLPLCVCPCTRVLFSPSIILVFSITQFIPCDSLGLFSADGTSRSCVICKTSESYLLSCWPCLPMEIWGKAVLKAVLRRTPLAARPFPPLHLLSQVRSSLVPPGDAGGRTGELCVSGRAGAESMVWEGPLCLSWLCCRTRPTSQGAS